MRSMSEARSRIALGVLVSSAVVLAALLGPTPPVVPRSWPELLAPLGAGSVIDGYVLSAPRRGEEHDVVLAATRARASDRAAGRAEIHVLDRGRWPGVRETASFGVAYEAPRSYGDTAELERVRDAIADAIDVHDRGDLGPVDAIPLERAPGTSMLARRLSTLSGARGALAALAMAALVLALGALRHRGFRFGRLLVGLVLFAAGLAVRATSLDLPFPRDQDVQRVLMGALPVSEILFGRGLSDRHSPLWFLVLHAVEWAGQAPWIVRIPSAIAGACIAPAIAWASDAPEQHRPHALLAALLAALSPPLVGVAREVGEIPFFALALVLVVGVLARADREPTRTRVALVAVTHALAIATYYLGAIVLVGLWIGRSSARWTTSRPVGRAALAGVALGSPAIALALRALLRDLGPRAAAAAHPDRAWGDATMIGLGRALAVETLDAVGPVVLAAVLAGIAFRSARPTALASVLTLGVLAVLAPVARIQPYQALVVAPLLLLAVASVDTTERPSRERLARAGLIAACVIPLVSAGPALAALYAADADAVLGRYVVAARRAGVARIVAVADYDATLLAYEAARASHLRIDSAALDADGEGTLAIDTAPRIGFLTRSHDGAADAAQRAATRLRLLASREPIAVVARDAFPMPEVDGILEGCAPLDASPTTRLVLCGGATTE